MRNKNEMLDYVDKDYFIADGQLFRLYDKMDIQPVKEENKFRELNSKFEIFKRNNKKVCTENKLIPDSLKKYN